MLKNSVDVCCSIERNSDSNMHCAHIVRLVMVLLYLFLYNSIAVSIVDASCDSFLPPVKSIVSGYSSSFVFKDSLLNMSCTNSIKALSVGDALDVIQECEMKMKNNHPRNATTNANPTITCECDSCLSQTMIPPYFLSDCSCAADQICTAEPTTKNNDKRNSWPDADVCMKHAIIVESEGIADCAELLTKYQKENNGSFLTTGATVEWKYLKYRLRFPSVCQYLRSTVGANLKHACELPRDPTVLYEVIGETSLHIDEIRHHCGPVVDVIGHLYPIECADGRDEKIVLDIALDDTSIQQVTCYIRKKDCVTTGLMLTVMYNLSYGAHVISVNRISKPSEEIRLILLSEVVFSKRYSPIIPVAHRRTPPATESKSEFNPPNIVIIVLLGIILCIVGAILVILTKRLIKETLEPSKARGSMKPYSRGMQGGNLNTQKPIIAEAPKQLEPNPVGMAPQNKSEDMVEDECHVKKRSTLILKRNSQIQHRKSSIAPHKDRRPILSVPEVSDDESVKRINYSNIVSLVKEQFNPSHRK